jgi:hypothetical protein
LVEISYVSTIGDNTVDASDQYCVGKSDVKANVPVDVGRVSVVLAPIAPLCTVVVKASPAAAQI